MKTFTQFVSNKRSLNEKENLKKEYKEVFQGLLDKYEVDSPAELSDDKKSEFFDEISKYYKAGEGATDKGEELIGKSNESLNEEGLQKEYQEIFKSLLKKYDTESPDDLSDEKKKEFFSEISKYYKAGEGATDKGKELIKESNYNKKTLRK